MALDLTDAPPVRAGSNGADIHRPGYLAMVDVCRIVVCAAVVAQHSFLWAHMSHNDIGTGFVTMLHFTRDAFFALSGLVVCHAQLTRPRSTVGLWWRRFVQLGVPFVVWTCIYVVYTILSTTSGWGDVDSLLWYNLRLGYYQLYVVIVLFQFYLVCPLLLWLLRATRHHGLILAVSLGLAMLIGVDLHFNPDIGALGRGIHDIGAGWVWSRNLVSYQLYFVLGALVAFHIDQVRIFVARWYRTVIAASVTVGAATLVWYVVAIAGGASTGSASDIYQPIAVAWALAASAGIFTVGWIWTERRRLPGAPPRRPGRLMSHLAEISGGVFFCHVLCIGLVRSALSSSVIGGADLPWPIKVGLFYVGTLALAITFVSLVVRTPLRWVLGGPVRSQQRAAIESAVAESATRARGARRGQSPGAPPVQPARPAPRVRRA